MAPVCTTKHRCMQSKECLVQEWICDGDQDCKDGTDEKVVKGNTTCLKFTPELSFQNKYNCKMPNLVFQVGLFHSPLPSGQRLQCVHNSTLCSTGLFLYPIVP